MISWCSPTDAGAILREPVDIRKLEVAPRLVRMHRNGMALAHCAMKSSRLIFRMRPEGRAQRRAAGDAKPIRAI